jgi:putative sterol carrier protein
MRDLRDSSEIAQEPDRLRQRIAEDGYVFFRGLLDPQPIRALAGDLLSALQREGWLRDGVAAEEAPLVPPARDFKNANFYGGYTALQRLEYFHALPHEPALTEIMRNLLGPDVFLHPRKTGRIVWPTRLGTTPGIYPHQDFVVEGVPDMFTSWIPFVDCPRELGGLAVLVGSQNQGVAPRFDQVDRSDDTWATTDYKVGDVLIFHCLTAHAALANGTDGLRLSGDYRWQSAADPVPADSLLPHLHGAVPGWDELTRGWTDTRWVAAPDGLRVVDRVGGESPTVPGSRYVTVPPQSPRDGEHTVLAGLFNNLKDAFRPAKAAGRSAVIQYRISSGSELHEWQLAIADGACRVTANGSETPDVVISAEFRDYVRIMGGKLHPGQAFATGSLRIEGDVTIALEQLQWFRD